jgi:hypothetical protein
LSVKGCRRALQAEKEGLYPLAAPCTAQAVGGV